MTRRFDKFIKSFSTALAGSIIFDNGLIRSIPALADLTKVDELFYDIAEDGLGEHATSDQ